MERLKLAVWKLASCDGCQLQVLAADRLLLELGDRVVISVFLEATSRSEPGPWDLSLVEGSVSTREDARRLARIRRQSRHLVTIGACATAGGIQALRNFADHDLFRSRVYPNPEYIRDLATSTPVSRHVPVDLEIHGCPVNPDHVRELILCRLSDRWPVLPDYSVCEQCKARGLTCVLVAGDQPCLGPSTRAGCGALCPAVGRGCYGCFGPAETAATRALSSRLASLGTAPEALGRAWRTFNAAAPAFAAESERHGD